MVTGAPVDNVTGNLDNQWLGQYQRRIESGPSIAPSLQMGARLYNPILGRFLGVDPVDGGCLNSYVYVEDPVNRFDLAGTADPCGDASKDMRRALFGDKKPKYGGRGSPTSYGMKGVISRLGKILEHNDMDKGHLKAFRSELRTLRKAYDKWKGNKCGPGPGGPHGGLVSTASRSGSILESH